MVSSLLAPFAYISVLVVGMLTFSRYQRNKKAGFPTHPSRDLYITLLQTTPTPHEHILMSALLLRATEDIRRIMLLRERKPVLQTLIQKGSLGDETAARFQAAEKEIEAEVTEVIGEANTFKPGWGQWIFASAAEMVGKEKVRGVLDGISKVKEEEESKLKARTEYKSLHPSSQPPTIPAILPSTSPLPPSTPTKPTPNSTATPISLAARLQAAAAASAQSGLAPPTTPERAGSVTSDVEGDVDGSAGSGSGVGVGNGASPVKTPSKSAKKKNKKK